jgi:hypothetical protein
MEPRYLFMEMPALRKHPRVRTIRRFQMADDNAVVFAVGFLEGYIDGAENKGVPNATAARQYLSLIEAAYHEYRRKIDVLQKLITDAKGKLDAATSL